ncbi:UbiA prenyltransferase [Cristinia sonorae]|uniref:4-hydroxybenzoate polyprenyltransferase, mitochondrial n=1 Tax=Cristinia sonorae TaxID=1940300 RepID=A0A8K0UT75_9AGAR|nr:UbiA prenyltransferase [Cristinia sonorae]
MPIQPYLELIRIHKPAGGALFLWPMVWGVAMAAYANKTPIDVVLVLLAKAVVGAFIIRGAACTVNDIFDRDFDAAVERTRNRPLASGRVSVLSATIFLLVQYIAGGLFFATYQSSLVFWVSMVEMIPLMAIYPLIKRVSYWPQAWLAISVNVLFAQSWFQIDDTFPQYPRVINIMIAGTCCWTMMYDTVYGCQDRKDDIQVGIWSTSLFFGKYVWEAAATFNVGFVVALFWAGVTNNHGLPYYVLSVAGAAVQLMYQLSILDVDSTESCWENFKNNAFYLGPLIFSGIMLDYARVNLSV